MNTRRFVISCIQCDIFGTDEQDWLLIKMIGLKLIEQWRYIHTLARKLYVIDQYVIDQLEMKQLVHVLFCYENCLMIYNHLHSVIFISNYRYVSY